MLNVETLTIDATLGTSLLDDQFPQAHYIWSKIFCQSPACNKKEVRQTETIIGKHPPFGSERKNKMHCVLRTFVQKIMLML